MLSAHKCLDAFLSKHLECLETPKQSLFLSVTHWTHEKTSAVIYQRAVKNSIWNLLDCIKLKWERKAESDLAVLFDPRDWISPWPLCTLLHLMPTAPLGAEAKCSQIQPESRLSFICVWVCVFYLNWPHSTDPGLNDISLWRSVSDLVVSILIHFYCCSPESDWSRVVQSM